MDYVVEILIKLLLVALLVFMNGFFVATEFAIVKVRPTQLEPLIIRGSRRAKLALHLTRHLDEYLSACQLGITLTSLGLGWIGEPVFETVLRPVFELLDVQSHTLRSSIAFLVGFTTITFLHVVAGEQAPKSLSIRKPVATSLFVAHPMRMFYMITYPFIWLLNRSALGLLKLVGIEPAAESESAVSEEELKLQISGMQKRQGVSNLSRAIVQNAFELRHRLVREVMRPRHEIVLFDTRMSIRDCVALAEQHRFSRYPLCQEGDPDKALGVVHIKDLYAAAGRLSSAAELRPLTRPVLYVPEVARLENALELFLNRRAHMALVVDEYGGVTGLLTLENTLEALVGEIQDEFDAEPPRVVRVDECTWHIDPALPLHQLQELVGIPLEAEGVTTAAGFVMYKLGGFPRPGDSLKLDGHELSVLEMDGLRITKLQLKSAGGAGAACTSLS